MPKKRTQKVKFMDKLKGLRKERTFEYDNGEITSDYTHLTDECFYDVIDNYSIDYDNPVLLLSPEFQVPYKYAKECTMLDAGIRVGTTEFHNKQRAYGGYLHGPLEDGYQICKNCHYRLPSMLFSKHNTTHNRACKLCNS